MSHYLVLLVLFMRNQRQNKYDPKLICGFYVIYEYTDSLKLNKFLNPSKD